MMRLHFSHLFKQVRRAIAILLIGFIATSIRATGADAADATPPQQHLHEVVRFGEDATVAAEENVSTVVVVNGDATIDGEVREGVVLVGGNLKVAGKIRGTIVVVFGDVDASSTAVIRRPAFVIGGKLLTQPGARVRSDNIIINQATFPVLTGFFSWVTQGAVYLRPLPPRVLWAWTVPVAFFFLYALMGLILSNPTERCVQVLVARPMACYLVGLLACVVFALCFLIFLILGAIGIGFILTFALLMLLCFGRMVVVRFVGFQLGQQLGLVILQRPIVTLLLGSLVLCVMYMIPVIGLAVWVGVFPLALGALAMAGIQAIRPTPSPHPEPTGVDNVSGVPPVPPPLSTAPTGGATTHLLGQPAGFFIRTLATLVDLIIVSVLAHLLAFEGRSFLLLWLGYHVTFWTWSGATLGARVFGLVLVEADGRPVVFQVALVRSLAAILSALPLGLGFIWAAWDLRKQSWHDKLAGTVILWRRR